MIRRALFIATAVLFASGAFAQEHAPAAQHGRSASPPAAQQEHKKGGEPTTPTMVPATPEDTRKANELEKKANEPAATIAGEEARVSNAAAGNEEGGEDAQFRKSPSVRTLSRLTGIPIESAYWVFVALNFVILAGILYAISKSRIPAMFRSRTEEIRKSLDEAQRSSSDANRRLSEIEVRLARLDAEVAEMRAQADREAAAEEERIRAAAEEDQRRIVAGSQAEIEALAKNARRELKAYAADLAVALAEKRIQVDAATDQQLVRSFTSQLGDDKGRN